MDHPTDPLEITFELRSNNYQPNIITESRQEFSETEKKIFVLAINQLRKVSQDWQPGQNVILFIPYSELTTGHHGKISAAANSLNTRRLFQLDQADPQQHEFDFIIPFPRVRSTKMQGRRYIELSMFADIVPAFIELGRRYTS